MTAAVYSAEAHAKPPVRNEYAELKRIAEASGLLNPRRGYYLAKVVVNIALLGVALCGLHFASLGLGWWLADVTFMSFVFVQLALLGHDVAHFQFVRAGRLNTALGLVLGNLLLGVSRAWWNDNHGAHHARPNDLGHDPNINILFLACTPEQARSRPPWVRWIIRHQVALMLPIFALEFFSMQYQSLAYAIYRRAGGARAELWLLLGHYALYSAVLVLALGLSGALAFAVVQHLLTGVYMASIFAPNHKGMPLAPTSREVGGFLREQVLTSRNIRGNPLIDLVYGGLNYQIEHHLFPSMPRNNLRRIRPIVRTYCQRQGIAYWETGVLNSWLEILVHFGAVSRALNT